MSFAFRPGLPAALYFSAFQNPPCGCQAIYLCYMANLFFLRMRVGWIGRKPGEGKHETGGGGWRREGEGACRAVEEEREGVRVCICVSIPGKHYEMSNSVVFVRT